MGARDTVIRGDVVDFSDVQRGVDSYEGFVGGRIQAAMALWV